jgi:hypothetical protein
MSANNVCDAPLSLDALVAYWLDEPGEAERSTIEEHLFDCSACGARLEDLVTLGAGIRAAVRSGRTHAVVSSRFPERLAAAGLRVREYRVACNGSVNCTVAPDDDVVVTRLAAPLAGVGRLDLVVLAADGGDGTRLENVPFDVPAEEVVFTPDIARLRALPATTQRMRLVAVGQGAERVVGEYTFHHSPWPGAT